MERSWHSCGCLHTRSSTRRLVHIPLCRCRVLLNRAYTTCHSRAASCPSGSLRSYMVPCGRVVSKVCALFAAEAHLIVMFMNGHYWATRRGASFVLVMFWDDRIASELFEPRFLHYGIWFEITIFPILYLGKIQIVHAVIHDICLQLWPIEYFFKLSLALDETLHVPDLRLAILHQSLVPLEGVLPKRKVTSLHIVVLESLAAPRRCLTLIGWTFLLTILVQMVHYPDVCFWMSHEHTT